jgi:transposase InsO family protein
MSRKGNGWDNARAESFFKTLKAEVDKAEGRHSKEEVRVAVFEYIELYYNKRRRHSALGYAIPIAHITALLNLLSIISGEVQFRLLT